MRTLLNSFPFRSRFGSLSFSVFSISSWKEAWNEKFSPKAGKFRFIILKGKKGDNFWIIEFVHLSPFFFLSTRHYEVYIISLMKMLSCSCLLLLLLLEFLMNEKWGIFHHLSSSSSLSSSLCLCPPLSHSHSLTHVFNIRRKSFF